MEFGSSESKFHLMKKNKIMKINIEVVENWEKLNNGTPQVEDEVLGKTKRVPLEV